MIQDSVTAIKHKVGLLNPAEQTVLSRARLLGTWGGCRSEMRLKPMYLSSLTLHAASGCGTASPT